MHVLQEINSALTATRDTSATPDQVWAVMADGWTYSQWVVGNGRMRAVDADWPAPGSKIHHTIGVWPLIINDETVVEARTPRQELVLLARVRPFGRARITLRLAASPTGCRTTNTCDGADVSHSGYRHQTVWPLCPPPRLCHDAYTISTRHCTD
jgi:hypothetical protein